MKRIAAIDIGTNTALLLVAEIRHRREIHPLIQKETIVRLGEGVDKTRALKQKAIERTLTALNDYVEIAHDAGAKVILASGTSALRDAENRDSFIEQVSQLLNIDIQVLTGDEEARLTYLGALSNKTYLQGKIILIDIGGGSTEFICGNEKTIEYATSLDIGSVRLTERYVKHDPIKDYEFKVIKQTVRRQLETILDKMHKNNKHFLGVAGTVTTLSAIHMELELYSSELVDGSIMTFNQIAQIIHRLKIKPLEERKMIRGLKPERADVILAGAVILWEIMRQFHFDKLLVSDRGLRFGLISRYLQKKSNHL